MWLVAGSFCLSALADTLSQLPSLCSDKRNLFLGSHCERRNHQSAVSFLKSFTSFCTQTPEPGRAPTRVRAKSLSASEIEVTWKALPWNASKKRVLGYEVSCNKKHCLHWILMHLCSTTGCKCVGACASAWQLMLVNLVLVYYWWVFQAHAPWA